MLGGLVVRKFYRYLPKLSAAIVLTAVLLGALVGCARATPTDKPPVLLSLPTADMSCAPTPSAISARSAAVIELSSGQTLWEKDADTRMPMASTTKIMTALVALENCDVQKKVKVSPLAVGIEGSSVYLYAGEELTMEDLLYAMLLSSANDAAAAIAIEVGGSIEGFAQMMNDRARQLGLEDTHFENPHGLDGETHYTTARELALITREAMSNETFRKIVSTYKHVIPLDGDNGARLLINHNKLLRYYDGAIGVKTGFTKKSGRCLVSAAQRDGVEYICVTLNAPSDWNDHRALLDYASSLYERRVLCSEGEYIYSLPLVNCDKETVQVTNSEEVSIILPRGCNGITCRAEIPRMYFGSIKKGERVGTLVFLLDGEQIAQAPICSVEDAQQISYKFNLFEWIGSLFT